MRRESSASDSTAVHSREGSVQPDEEKAAQSVAEESAEIHPKETQKDQNESCTPVEDASAWLHVLAAFLVFFMTWGPSTGFGAFESFYENDLLVGYSISDIAWIGGVQTFLLVGGGVVSGPLFDQGHAKPMMIIGLGLCVLGFVLLSFSTEYYQVFLTQGVVFGLGTGLAYIPSLAMVSVRFVRNRAVAVGLVTSGSSVGGMIFPILIRRLQPQIGFPWTSRVIALLLLTTSIVVLLILARDQQPRRSARKVIQLHAFKEAPFTLFSIAYFLQILAFWIPLVLVTSYALDRLHLSDDLSFYLLAVVNGASFFGRVLPCIVAQRFGAFNVLMVATVACAALLFGWIGCTDVNSFIAFCVLWGFFSGVIPSMVPLCVVVKPLSPSMDVTGTRLGMAWLACSFGTLVGNPIAGRLIDIDGGSYLGAQVFTGAMMAGAAAFYVWPWICHERVRREEKRSESD